MNSLTTYDWVRFKSSMADMWRRTSIFIVTLCGKVFFWINPLLLCKNSSFQSFFKPIHFTIEFHFNFEIPSTHALLSYTCSVLSPHLYHRVGFGASHFVLVQTATLSYCSLLNIHIVFVSAKPSLLYTSHPWTAHSVPVSPEHEYSVIVWPLYQTIYTHNLDVSKHARHWIDFRANL